MDSQPGIVRPRGRPGLQQGHCCGVSRGRDWPCSAGVSPAGLVVQASRLRMAARTVRRRRGPDEPGRSLGPTPAYGTQYSPESQPLISTHINQMRAKLRAGELVLGVGITLTDPTVTEALAGCVDFVWIDLEHNATTTESML